ncbi:MAG TPA: metallophosphoesterase [Candidatus Acidoferrales bacterium]|nr:metallophosphoesterase [Candidatus Acidoferrales bacterium]
MKPNHRLAPAMIFVAIIFLIFGLAPSRMAAQEQAQDQETVTPIKPPATPLPEEASSAGVTKFTFFAYGDTRSRLDGTEIQYDHSLIVDSMVKQIKQLQNTDYPVRFILQSGDAVAHGQNVKEWNVSFVPLIDRLTQEGDVPYFLAPGNHDVSSAETADAAKRQIPLKNYLAAVSALIPPDGSPHRMSGYPTYSFAYGNTYVIALDADIASDEKQFQWVKSQLEGLDATRYVNIIVFCHQAPFSSGPHGGPKVEEPTVALRAMYMPLFQQHHVRIVFSGHEHLFEHWVEHYTDASGTHRMDLVVSGGGGAPLYGYSGEPNLDDYLKANTASKVTLEHLVKPGVERGSTPFHYLIVRVDGQNFDMQVVGVDWGADFQPYRSNKVSLQDQ